MSLETCKFTFTQQSGTGAQVVTVAALTFVPAAFMVWSNTQVTNSANMSARLGFDDGAGHRRGCAYNAGDFLGGGDNCESAGSDAYSFITVRSVAFNQINALGYISAKSVGSITVQWDQNSNGWSAGVVWHVLAIGGSGITAEVGSLVPIGGAGTQTLTFGISDVKALLTFHVAFVPSATLNGAGLAGMGLGLATACGTSQAATSMAEDFGANPSNNATKQLTDTAFLTSTTSTTPNHGAITSWDTNAVHLTWTASDNLTYFGYLAVGGSFAANLVTVTQPSSTGVQRYTYPIADPQAVLIVSAGKAATSSISPGLSWTLGAGTVAGTVGVIWTGDADGKSPPAWADKSPTNTTDLALFGVPTGEATSTYPAAATLTDLSQGSMGWDWTAADATPREILAIILGADTQMLPCGGAAPPTITTYATRRVRRFQLPFDTNKWMKINTLEFLPQPGVGLSTGQGSDPVVMVRFSKDGGATFGYEIPCTIGKIGEYAHRAYLNRGPRGRNLVCEVATSDPVFAALLECWVDYEVGTS